MSASPAGAGGTGNNPWPKILLAKPNAPAAPPSAAAAIGAPVGPGVVKLMRDRDDEAAAARARPPSASLNLLTDTWEFAADRVMPHVSDNTDFTVIGVLGTPGAGKSTILNELYGFDGSSGILPPFPVQSDETKAMARHCTTGLEFRMAAERFILLDAQPLYSASVLADLMRPDGSSSVSVLGGDTLSAELAHELMGIQLGVFLSSVCHVLLVVTEGIHDSSMWRLMRTVEMLKQGILDPSLLGTSTGASYSLVSDKDEHNSSEDNAEYFADTVFIHTKLWEMEWAWNNISFLEKSLNNYFTSPAFRRNGVVTYVHPESRRSTVVANKQSVKEELTTKQESQEAHMPFGTCNSVNFYVLPLKLPDEPRKQPESYGTMMKHMCNQILAMPRKQFAKSLSEREWLRNAARTWELVRKSAIISDYSKMLQSSGLFRK